jgi:hypothetical protein
LDGREVPIFRNFPNRHPFFEFKIFFNPFLKKILVCGAPNLFGLLGFQIL